jgi:tetratricopeptide (TPR) repeat protein
MRQAIMVARFALACVALACLSPARGIATQGSGPTEQAQEFVNQGNLDRAIQLLRNHLSKNAKDVQAREFLGRILDFDGRPDEAVAEWEKGLNGSQADFPLLMAIGETRHRQGIAGPTISRRRGTILATPSKNEADEERFKRSHLAQAATAYEKASKLRPNEPEVARALAYVYSQQNKHDSAAEIWKSVVKMEPAIGENYLGLALETRETGRSDEAAGYAKQAINLNPRLAGAHEALAEYHKKKGHAAEADQERNRAEFYDRLPSFCTLVYSDDNLKALESLNQEASVRKLAQDPSRRAAEFLAVLCWSHPHNRLETEAFEALEARGAETTPLLRALLEGARSTCTIKSTAHILARRKDDGIFDYLVRMLPGDLRGFGMDMDVAGSLDDLGDPRAVGALTRVLNPEGAVAAQETGLLTDRTSARARAAMALGAFNTPEARRALDAGTGDPAISAYCLAALYRLTKDPKHLAVLEKSIGPDSDYKTYVVGNYLLKKAGTDEAKKLAQKRERQREVQRAEDEPRKKHKPEPRSGNAP